MDRQTHGCAKFRTVATGLALAGAAVLAACAGPTPRYALREPAPSGAERGGLRGTDKPYEIDGRWYYPKAQPDFDQVGLASWYGAAEHNHHTANGEIFDQYGLSAAHKTLPLPSIVEVTNLANGRRVRVRLNDRGPFVDGRLIDLSRGAAEQLGFDRQGVARVRVRYIGAAPPLAAVGVMQAKLSPRHATIAAPAPDPVLSAAPDLAPRPAPPPPIDNADQSEDEAPAAAPAYTAPIDPAPVYAVQADYRVQVGAYASRDDAVRAATRLGDGARYMIEPVARPGAVLYRVVLGGYLDEDDALAAQLRFAAAGFPTARVLKPF